MRASTKKLVEALEQANAPESMKARARAGCYSDIDSESATPITDLVRAAWAEGLTGIVNAAKVGAFDSGRKEWRQ